MNCHNKGHHSVGKEIKGAMMLGMLLLTSLLIVRPPAAMGADADGIVGVWDTADKDAKIEIYKCGPHYCGRIVQIEDPTYPPDDEEGMGGLPLVDRNNPDPGLRARPLLGLTFIEGFSYEGDDKWGGGRIYNPENGKFYHANIRLAGTNRLKLRGYWVIPLLGRTEIWARSAPCLSIARGAPCAPPRATP